MPAISKDDPPNYFARQGGEAILRSRGCLPVPRHLRGDSLAAIILDSYGNWNTAVAFKKSMKQQARHDELCLIIPGVKLREPVPWGAIPILINIARFYLDWWVDTRNDPDFGGFAEHVTMYKLRRSENSGSGPRYPLHLPEIAFT